MPLDTAISEIKSSNFLFPSQIDFKINNVHLSPKICKAYSTGLLRIALPINFAFCFEF